MSGGETEAWLELVLTPKLGPAAQRKLLRAFGTPREALQASTSEIARAAGEAVAAALRSGPDSALVGRSLEWLQEDGNHLLTLADERFPQILLKTADPPLLLFVKGRIELLAHPALAVVGSRSATARGIRDAEAFAQALSDSGSPSSAGLPSA